MNKFIPKIIYQSWKTKNLPIKMLNNVKKIKKMNPKYEYKLFDDKDCRNFLLENFGINYANAFDTLLFGPFKCDFWRYAILYVYGGIYIDLDLIPLCSFDDIILEEDVLITVADRSFFNVNGIYQAFIAVIPKHPVLLYCLNISFFNIMTRRNENIYVLNITGPGVALNAINLYWNKKKTLDYIKPSIYEDKQMSIRLGKQVKIKILKFGSENGFKEFIYDLNNKKIFSNKYEGFVTSKCNFKKLYSDDPHKHVRYFFIIIISIITILFYFICKKLFQML